MEKKDKKNLLREYLPYIIIILVIILIRTFIITPVRVSGDSMYPTLTNGEIMILDKLSSINRYDIVVIDKIVVVKKGKVRRAKLNFIKGMRKEYKVKERN